MKSTMNLEEHKSMEENKLEKLKMKNKDDSIDDISLLIKKKSKKSSKNSNSPFRNNYKNYQYDYEEDFYEPRY